MKQHREIEDLLLYHTSISRTSGEISIVCHKATLNNHHNTLVELFHQIVINFLTLRSPTWYLCLVGTQRCFHIALDNIHFPPGCLCVFYVCLENYAPGHYCSNLSTSARTLSVATEFVDCNVQCFDEVCEVQTLGDFAPPFTKNSDPQTFPGLSRFVQFEHFMIYEVLLTSTLCVCFAKLNSAVMI